MRRTLLFYAIVLAGIAAAVLVLRGDRNGGPDAVARVATIYVECSAYYRRTADVLVGENDPDTAQQYSDKAALALGPVDKVDSQIGLAVIQDCFLGGGFGTWGFVGRRVAAHWRAFAS